MNRLLDKYVIPGIMDKAFSTGSAGDRFDILPPEEIEAITIEVDGVGQFPAWVREEKQRATGLFVVATHGLGKTVEETLPFHTAAQAANVSSISIQMPNHAGTPIVNNGRPTYGPEESRAFKAAIDYGLMKLGHRYISAGISMGATAVLHTLLDPTYHNSNRTRGVMLVAPVLNIRGVIHDQAGPKLREMVPGLRSDKIAEIGSPRLIDTIGRQIAKLATNRMEELGVVQWGPTDYFTLLAQRGMRGTPLLIMHSRDDDVIPYGYSSKILSKLAAHNNQLCTFENQGHVRGWDRDPEPYIQKMSIFTSAFVK